MIIFFDMDGVLLDSERMLVEIYRSLGVHPPENLLSCENQRWLYKQVGRREDEVRRHKDAMYAGMIRRGEVPLLPPLVLANDLRARGQRVHLITSAAYSAVDALMQFLSPCWPFVLVAAKVRPHARDAIFNEFKGNLVYVDDQPFQSQKARVIRYIGQPNHELLREISEWTSV